VSDDELRPGWREVPAPSRLAPGHPRRAEILAAHGAALAAGEAMYRDPVSGFMAMTAETLAARPCCGNLCRHCPWVDE
jgi:hypothetical protein